MDNKNHEEAHLLALKPNIKADDSMDEEEQDIEQKNQNEASIKNNK